MLADEKRDLEKKMQLKIKSAQKLKEINFYTNQAFKQENEHYFVDLYNSDESEFEKPDLSSLKKRVLLN